MKKIAAVICATSLALGSAMTAHAYVDGVTSLDSSDFFVESDDLSTISYLEPYDYNIADWLYAVYPSGGTRTFWFDSSTDPTIQGVITTLRDVRLGSTMDDVANAYGPALIDDEPFNDALYVNAVSGGWSNIKRIFDEQVISSVSYLYRYQPKWRVGEITFYFDSYRCVCMISYATGSWPNATFLNNRSIARAVQTQLTDEGYDCGAVDGVYGPSTRNAIMAWQEDDGDDPNGVIDYALMQDLLDEDELDSLLDDLNVAWGDDYGYEPIEDTYDILNQSGEDNTGDSTGTWDINSQS